MVKEGQTYEYWGKKYCAQKQQHIRLQFDMTSLNVLVGKARRSRALKYFSR